MPLPQGRWKAVIDGAEAFIDIGAVGADGHVFATLQLVGGGPQVVRGLWNEAAQQVTLWVRWNAAVPNGVEESSATLTNSRIFTGHLMKSPIAPAAGQDITWTFAGSLVAGPDAGGDRRRERFGWYATIVETM